MELIASAAERLPLLVGQVEVDEFLAVQLGPSCSGMRAPPPLTR